MMFPKPTKIAGPTQFMAACQLAVEFNINPWMHYPPNLILTPLNTNKTNLKLINCTKFADFYSYSLTLS